MRLAGKWNWWLPSRSTGSSRSSRSRLAGRCPARPHPADATGEGPGWSGDPRGRRGYDRTRVAPRPDLDQPHAAARTHAAHGRRRLARGRAHRRPAVDQLPACSQAVNNVIHLGGADFGLFQGQVTELTSSLLPDQLAGQVASTPGVQEAARIKLLVTTVDGRAHSWCSASIRASSRSASSSSSRASRRGATRSSSATHAASSLGSLRATRSRSATRSCRSPGIYHSGNSFEDGGGRRAAGARAALGRTAGRGHLDRDHRAAGRRLRAAGQAARAAAIRVLSRSPIPGRPCRSTRPAGC